jgi:hypothetical protein
MTGRRDLPYWCRYNLLLYVRVGPGGPEMPGRLAAGTPAPDVSPPLFKLRKAFFRRMPTPLLDRLAGANARLNH